MLLRLTVKGFKNLQDVTVHFGPTTCFVGPNGVGKSNLFDAVHFLKLLAETDLQDAASRVRRPLKGAHNPLDLFYGGDPSGRIVLDADLLVGKTVVDDFERPTEPSATLLNYRVVIRYAAQPSPRLELEQEWLTHHKHGDAASVLGFPHDRGFRASVLGRARRGGPLISTVEGEGTPEIKLHQDGGSRGQPFPPGRSPRTVLGGTNTYEFPTVLAARREMMSWNFLHLEPSAMRSPDPLGTPPRVTEQGGGVAATLDALHRLDADRPGILQEVVNQLRSLNSDIAELRVDRDEAREQLVVEARTRGLDRWLGPRSLSDGTLRYLALVVMGMSPETGSMLCMEEPENGMHPTRVPALIDLLSDFAVDPTLPVDDANPARQVVLNTHSPDVVRRLAPEDVLFVETESGRGGRRAVVRPVRETWRDTDGQGLPKERVAAYIGGAPLGPAWEDPAGAQLLLALGTA